MPKDSVQKCSCRNSSTPSSVEASRSNLSSWLSMCEGVVWRNTNVQFICQLTQYVWGCHLKKHKCTVYLSADSVCVRVLSEETERSSLCVQLTQYVWGCLLKKQKGTFHLSADSVCVRVFKETERYSLSVQLTQYVWGCCLKKQKGTLHSNRKVHMCPADSVCVRVSSDETEMYKLLPSAPVLATHILARTLHSAS